MYCRNSIILHLIRGIAAISLIYAVFLFQLPLLLKLFLVVGAFCCYKVVLPVGC